MQALLVGYGEIGKAVAKTFNPYHHITVYDTLMTAAAMPSTDIPFEILLVAIPFENTQQFTSAVQFYKHLYRIESTLVFSTVAVGTCTRISAVHCPVEGRHPDLAPAMSSSYKWLGGYDPKVIDFITQADFRYSVCPTPEQTEFMKLRSTTLYGLNIEFARYTKKVCEDLHLDYQVIQEWDTWVNGIYVDEPRLKRYILDPPDGPKGGHCVTHNARILQAQYPDALVNRVAEYDI